jgi:lipopolysaccharide transport system ATP-binding protein
MRPILEIDHISKKFRIRHLPGGYLSIRESLSSLSLTKTESEEFWALTDVSFHVQPGESVGIIGRNGAGKSTLLKILSRITPPTKGRFITRGRVASLLEVGTGFHPELTGRENVFLNGSLLGMKRQEIVSRFDEIVDFSGTEKFLDTPLKHFSSGMQLRLAFSVAAFLSLEVLIVDEVLAVGDAEFQRKCIGKMEDVGKQGRSIIFVSHNMGAIKNLCQRTLFLEHGKVEFDGDSDQAIQHYLNASREVALGSALHRPANARCWMESIFVNGSDRRNVSLYYGDELTVEVHCRSVHKGHAFLGFVITTLAGEKIFNANNRYVPHKAPLSPDRVSIIRSEFGRVPLMSGNYIVSLYMGDESGDVHIVENGFQIEVIERDIWGSGQQPPKNSGYFWWEVRYSNG